MSSEVAVGSRAFIAVHSAAALLPADARDGSRLALAAALCVLAEGSFIFYARSPKNEKRRVGPSTAAAARTTCPCGGYTPLWRAAGRQELFQKPRPRTAPSAKRQMPPRAYSFILLLSRAARRLPARSALDTLFFLPSRALPLHFLLGLPSFSPVLFCLFFPRPAFQYVCALNNCSYPRGGKRQWRKRE